MRQTSRFFSQRPVMIPSSLTKVPSFSICPLAACPMNFYPPLNVQTTLPSISPHLKCPSTSIIRFSRSFAKASSTSLPQPCNFPLRHSPWYTISLFISSLPKPDGFQDQLQLPRYSSPPTKVILMNLSWILSFLRACRLAAPMCLSSSTTARIGSSRLTIPSSFILERNLLEAMLLLCFSSASSAHSSLDCAMGTSASLPIQMFSWLCLSSIFLIRLILLIVSLPLRCVSTGFLVIFMPWLLQFLRNLSASWQLSIWPSAPRLSWLPALVALGEASLPWLSSISCECSDCTDMVSDRSCSLTSRITSSPSNRPQSSSSSKSTAPPSPQAASEPTEFLMLSTSSASQRTRSSFSAFCCRILALLFYSSSCLMECAMHWFLRKEFSSLRRATSSLRAARAARCYLRTAARCMVSVFWIWFCVSARSVRQWLSCWRRNCWAESTSRRAALVAVTDIIDNIASTKQHQACCLLHIHFIMLRIQSWLIETAPLAYYLTAALGSLYVLNCLFILLCGALRLLLHRKLNLVERYGEKSWALVTGSSEGIGREFALQLARDGFNVVLLARTEAKLQAVRQEILKLYPAVKVELIVADLGKEGRKEKAEELLPQLLAFRDISILVNNAGVDVLDNFTNLAPATLIDLLNLNCNALAALTHRFIPLFEERSQRTGKKCAIINVGSVAGETPLALHNAYSASKAYVNLLTANLAKEQPKIDWLCLKPAHVTTAMTGFKKDFFCVSAQQCVAGALKDLGHVVLSNGALWHKLQSFLFASVPRWLFTLVWVKVVAKENMAVRRLAGKRKSD